MELEQTKPKQKLKDTWWSICINLGLTSLSFDAKSSLSCNTSAACFILASDSADSSSFFIISCFACLRASTSFRRHFSASSFRELGIRFSATSAGIIFVSLIRISIDSNMGCVSKRSSGKYLLSRCTSLPEIHCTFTPQNSSVTLSCSSMLSTNLLPPVTVSALSLFASFAKWTLRYASTAA
ncbi:hypothetical protein H5410_061660 [Solanum commersonii]|uniref:Uncharacterized protein n=1 Tax=Solanum commersonii TaxID=4109 RepID=A0A9J5WAA3_SOLCO|nr:hypothetical protein H5410_061660 [Solanum commersonii]